MTITETTPVVGSAEWHLTGIECREAIAGCGTRLVPQASYDLTARTFTLTGVPAPPLPSSPNMMS